MSKFGYSFWLVFIIWVLLYFIQAPFSILLLFPFLYLGFLLSMSFCIQCNFFTNSISKTTSGNILLSFDDGPDPEKTGAILATLKKHDAKAAFFIIGKNIAGNENLIKQMLQDGHLVGNHSFSHPTNFGFWPTEKVRGDIERTQMLLRNLSNQNNILFRPPFGVTNPRIAAAIKIIGTQSVGWSLRSFDTAAKVEEKLLNRILKKVKTEGDIILLHDTQEITVRILDRLITQLKNRNFTFKAELG